MLSFSEILGHIYDTGFHSNRREGHRTARNTCEDASSWRAPGKKAQLECEQELYSNDQVIIPVTELDPVVTSQTEAETQKFGLGRFLDSLTFPGQGILLFHLFVFAGDTNPLQTRSVVYVVSISGYPLLEKKHPSGMIAPSKSPGQVREGEHPLFLFRTWEAGLSGVKTACSFLPSTYPPLFSSCASFVSVRGTMHQKAHSHNCPLSKYTFTSIYKYNTIY